MGVEVEMSLTAVRASTQVRRSCQFCLDRKARLRHHGAVKADRDHVLCFACCRAERDRRHADLLSELPLQVRLASPSPALGEREIAHRQRMLAHLMASR
jgi:hypothetical protein